MIRWNASPELIEFGNYSLRYYSLMFVIGFVVMGTYVSGLLKKRGKNPDLTSPLTNYIILGMLIGSRLVHCLFYEPEVYLRDPFRMLKVWEGGLASHGGYVGVFIAVWLFLKKHKELSFLWLMDLIAGPCIFVGALIRVGNFFNSEIFGAPTSLPWAIVFAKVDNVPRHPAQLYEALGYFAIAFILFWMERRKFTTWPRGSIFAAAIIMSTGFRFLVEFVKEVEPSEGSLGFMNMGQILSLVFGFFGVLLWVRLNRSEPPIKNAP